MKRVLTVLLAVLVTVASVEAGRKREKSGKVENGTFTDATYGFSLKAGDNWGVKLMDADANFRVSFAQKKFDVPPDYIQAPDYTKVPRLILWVDTSSMGPFPFIDSLISPTYKSKQKSDILKEFELLTERDVLPKGRKPFTVGADKGAFWEGRVPYTKEIQTSASGGSVRRVKLAYYGSILAVKRGDKMLVFHLMSEETFYETIYQDALAIINSLTWPEAPKN